MTGGDTYSEKLLYGAGGWGGVHSYLVGGLVLRLVQAGGGAEVAAGHVVDVVLVVEQHDLALSKKNKTRPTAA